jgi:hypothetical protein
MNINELFCQHNPELSLMIKNSMTQNYKDYILIEHVTFNYPRKNCIFLFTNLGVLLKGQKDSKARTGVISKLINEDEP